MWRAALFAPVLIPQALWVMARATRLPEAAGAREGSVGEGPLLRLLILGDSSAAGVGVATQAKALSGQLSADLARDFAVEWRLVARSGVTVEGVLAMVEEMPAEPFDAALVCVGVNDVKNGVPRARWRAGYGALLRVLRERHGVARVVVSGLPPMAQFPLLPRPLSDVLGARAVAFDADLRALAAEASVAHLPFHVTDEVGLMADDGFHPGAEIYADWAARVAALMREA